MPPSCDLGPGDGPDRRHGSCLASIIISEPVVCTAYHPWTTNRRAHLSAHPVRFKAEFRHVSPFVLLVHSNLPSSSYIGRHFPFSTVLLHHSIISATLASRTVQPGVLLRCASFAGSGFRLTHLVELLCA